MNKLLKTVVWIIITALILIAGFILYITLTDYKPAKKLDLLSGRTPVPGESVSEDTLEVISWNIGYAGLGAEMDFFYDGGSQVRPARDLSEKYLAGILESLQHHSPQFWLIQEVDVRSKRTYRVNEVSEIEKRLASYHSVFTYNYRVPFVPVPLKAPMGRVNAGMMTLSENVPVEATRYAFPLIASWPDRLFLLDRCYILTRYPLAFESGDLVVMNTHNSAYVYDAELRARELEIIKKQMLAEYAAGHYVIAGGDWNANPPGYAPSGTYNGHRFEASQVQMDPGLLPDGWTWAYDPNAPTNRNNDKPFQKGVNGTTCLDYFVVSPNIDVLDIQTIDLDFRYSDHNPVYIRVRLKHADEANGE